ncbi:MAG: iron ABC transporter permease [Candidatus Omnitrophica bacterium]|nr:iron ABC transporter permease [Candidatus Omnitrophota bacterium]
MSRTDANHLPINRRAAIFRALLAAVFALPLLLLAGSVFPREWPAFVDSWRVFDLIALERFFSSVALSAWTLLFSLILASPVYVVFLGAKSSLRRWLLLFSILPLAHPPFGVASGWMILISRIEQSGGGRLLFERRGILSQWLYSQPGGGWLLALCFWPIVFLFLALSAQPRRSQIDAARIGLTRRAAIRHVLWPAWREPLLAAAAVIVCLCLLQFETPSLLQLRSYSLEIFTRFSIPENEWKALLLCLPYGIGALLLAWAMHRAKRILSLTAGDPPFTSVPGNLRRIAIVLTLIVFGLSILIPLASLIAQTGSIAFTLQTMTDHAGRLARSVFYAGAAACIIVLIGVVYAGQRRAGRDILFPALTIALFACPGILLASGWLRLRSYWPGVLPFSVMSLSMLGAYVAHRILLGYAAGALLWRSYGERAREFEDLMEMKIADKIRYLYFPAFFRPALFAVVLTALLLWGDVAITILLHPPGGDTLAVEYFNLLHYGSEARTAAIGFMLLLGPSCVMAAVFTAIALSRKIWLVNG